MTLCLVAEIPAFANGRGDGAFQGSFYGIPGHQKWVARVRNDVKSWNDTLSDGIIKSTGRRCGRFKFHLGNVG